MNSPQEPTLDSLDPLPGRVIAGNFRIEKLIGSGAMGNVYKAEQLSLGKAVAIKVLHAHLMNDQTLVMRFQREAKSASMLNHPNSIQIIDSGQDRDGTLFIAMELLAGRDLAEIIRTDFPLPLPRIVRIMAQVLSALDEAHAQGVVHRDLKPSNIMLIERRGEPDYVKVCDFGIAKAQGLEAKDDRAAMLTIQGLVCGTPEYMSPEQARAEPLDGRADLYSAAVILYQLVAGDIPFRADSAMGIVSRHLAEPPLAPSRRRPDLAIPAAVDAVVLRGMEKEREFRFPTAAAFREELEALAPNAARPATPIPGGRAGVPTQRMITGATGVLPGASPTSRAATTADLTPARSARGRKLAALSLALGAAAALVAIRLSSGPSPGMAPAAMGPASPSAPEPTAPQPSPAALESSPTGAATIPPAAAPAGAAPAAAPESGVPGPGWSGDQGADAPPRGATSRQGPHATRRKNKGVAARVPGATADAVAALAAPSVTGATLPGSGKVVAPAGEVASAPAPRELLAEGERLLGQGEVQAACARGEEAKRLNPTLPPTYKFLGKCYMRAGNIAAGKDNYTRYLELAPAAADSMFIKSIIK